MGSIRNDSSNKDYSMRATLLGILCCFSLFIGNAGAAEKGVAEKVAPPPMFAQILVSHKLRVGTYLSMPGAMKADDGKFSGGDIDIAERVAQDMGVTLEIKTFDWDQLIPALQRGDIDLIIAGLSITPERALQVYFSNPYSSSGISIATNIKLTADFSGIDNLNNPLIAIGVIGGTVSEDAARQIFPKAKIKIFAVENQAEDALVKGLLHAFVRTEPIPRFMALRHPKEVDVPITKPLVATREAFAVRRGDNDFVNFLNAWIVAREADAWLASTHKYWFESLNWQTANSNSQDSGAK
jgi:polar amino acid transport system substrate-binding protein